MMSDTILQTYCLGFGEKEGACLNCHCDEEAVHQNEKLCFLSLQLSFLFKSTWQACEHAVPSNANSSQKEVGPEIIVEEEETSLQNPSRGRAVSTIGTLASRPESLLKSSVKYIFIFGGPSRNSPIGVCLCEALV